jgi:hypothetical protein
MLFFWLHFSEYSITYLALQMIPNENVVTYKVLDLVQCHKFGIDMFDVIYKIHL